MVIASNNFIMNYKNSVIGNNNFRNLFTVRLYFLITGLLSEINNTRLLESENQQKLRYQNNCTLIW